MHSMHREAAGSKRQRTPPRSAIAQGARAAEQAAHLELCRRGCSKHSVPTQQELDGSQPDAQARAVPAPPQRRAGSQQVGIRCVFCGRAGRPQQAGSAAGGARAAREVEAGGSRSGRLTSQRRGPGWWSWSGRTSAAEQRRRAAFVVSHGCAAAAPSPANDCHAPSDAKNNRPCKHACAAHSPDPWAALQAAGAAFCCISAPTRTSSPVKERTQMERQLLGSLSRHPSTTTQVRPRTTHSAAPPPGAPRLARRLGAEPPPPSDRLPATLSRRAAPPERRRAGPGPPAACACCSHSISLLAAAPAAAAGCLLKRAEARRVTGPVSLRRTCPERVMGRFSASPFTRLARFLLLQGTAGGAWQVGWRSGGCSWGPDLQAGVAACLPTEVASAVCLKTRMPAPPPAPPTASAWRPPAAPARRRAPLLPPAGRAGRTGEG